MEALPLESDIRQRNAAISALYAQLYLADPRLFLWAGLAAFASFRVGLPLALYDFSYERQDTPSSDDIEDLLNDAQLLTSLEMLRQTNNEVFRSAGIAHIAYRASGWQIDAVRATANGDWKEPGLVEGFQRIDEGRRLLAAGRVREAETAIWRGNYLLAENEQRVTVERRFRQCHFQLGLVLSATSSIDFDANHLQRDKHTYTGFERYMWTRGLWRLLATASLPDITNVNHRWAWVSRSVLPIWRRVLATDTHLPQKLRRIAARSLPFRSDDYLKRFGAPADPA